MPKKREAFTAPQVPRVPGLPSVPRRSALRDRFPSFAPDIPVPQPEPIPEYTSRKAAWQNQFPAMSDLEFIVMDYLTRVKRWTLGLEFDYQLPIAGGRTAFGGFVIDFLVRPDLVLQPQGQRWHLQQPKDRARLRVESLLMSSRGYRVIYLWEDDLLTRPNFTIDRALKGQAVNSFRNVL